MSNKVVSFLDIQQIANKLAENIQSIVTLNGKANIAVSGGNTPLAIFEYWTKMPGIPWQNISIYWVDERLVPYESNESHYGNALRIFNKIDSFPHSSLHPVSVSGNSAAQSATLYRDVLRKNNVHKFDIILLGIGEDGHTASIFPKQEQLLTVDVTVCASVNPYSQQARVTLSGKTLLAAHEVVFIANGEQKKRIIEQVINEENIDTYPASYIYNKHNNSFIYTDIVF